MCVRNRRWKRFCNLYGVIDRDTSDNCEFDVSRTIFFTTPMIGFYFSKAN